MIPQEAVTEYLEAPRADHRWLKRKGRQAVLALLKKLFPDFNPNPLLKLHQLVCCLLGLKYPRFAFFCDMGLGKTLISLELLQYWWEQGCIRRALIFVISDKAFNTWERQIELYKIQIPYLTLDAGSSEIKWDMLDGFGDGLIILTYPGTVAMVAARLGGELGLDKKLIARLGERVDALVLDESTKVGYESSLRTMLCRQLAKQVDICYALAGRPFGRDPTMLWHQMKLIDGGASLGETLGLFRAAFFSATNNHWARKRGGQRGQYVKDFKFHKRKMPLLTDMVQHRSITYRDVECLDLPKVTPIIDEVSLPEEARAYYRRVVQEIIAAKGNLKEMKNPFTQMRQLSSGFLGFRDDDTGERAEVAFDENPKLDRLLELIQEMPEDRSAVIFYEFTFFGRKITEALKELDLDCVWLWSGTKNPRQELLRFTEGKCPIIVLNNKIGAYSLDGLQIANYLFFAESPVSVIDRDQAERRVNRQGQLHTIFQHDMVVRDTMDQRILDFHKEGRDLYSTLAKKPETFFKI